MKNQIKTLINRLLTPYRYSLLNKHITHIHGPESFNYEKDELVVVCLVRDGQVYIRSFIEYYFKMGVKHIVFMDNGSKDDTIKIAKEYKNITVLTCHLPYVTYQNIMKLYLVKKFCSGRWSLCTDIDEQFDYPQSNKIPLSSFLSYLNTHSYTAVVTQMLDMFSNKPIRTISIQNEYKLSDLYRYYDLSGVIKESYENHFGESNTISNKNIMTYIGGIRKKKFLIDRIMLTKHPLVLSDEKVKPLYKKRTRLLGRNSAHGVADAKLADISCVFYHYKFHEGLYDQAVNAVSEKNHFNNSYEYKQYLKVLNKNRDLILKDENALILKTTNQLVNNEFLVISDQYDYWVRQNECKI